MRRKSIPTIVFEAMADNIDLSLEELRNLPALRRRRPALVNTLASLRIYFRNQVAAVEGGEMSGSLDSVPNKVARLMADNPQLTNAQLIEAVGHNDDVNPQTVRALRQRSLKILPVWAARSNGNYRLAVRAKDRAVECYSVLKQIMDLDLPGMPDDLRFEAARLISRIERPPQPVG